MRIRRSYAIPATALLLASLAGPALAEVLNGTNGRDVLYGTAEADTIRGYKGGDTVYARAGNDAVYGGLWCGPHLRPDGR
jgi:Ca2+-binding RTX toxin-like protein